MIRDFCIIRKNHSDTDGIRKIDREDRKVIDFKLDIEKNQLELDASFTSADNFAEEMILMINTIINVTAYHGTGGEVERGRKFADQLKTVIAENLDRDCEYEKFCNEQKQIPEV